MADKYICNLYIPTSTLADFIKLEPYYKVFVCKETLTGSSSYASVTVIENGVEKTIVPGDKQVFIDQSNSSQSKLWRLSNGRWINIGSMYELFEIKDEWLRDQLDTLDSKGAQFIGVITDSGMCDGATLTTVHLVSGGTHTVETGDVVITNSNKEMFIYTNSNVWNLMGSTHGLGKLAFVSEADAKVTTINSVTIDGQLKYGKLSLCRAKLPKTYIFKSTTTDIAVTLTSAKATITGFNVVDNKVKIDGNASLTTSATTDKGFVSANMEMAATPAVSSISTTTAKKLGNKFIRTVTNTSTKSAIKAPTFDTPTPGTDLKITQEEELPTFYGNYTTHTETDNLEKNTTCGSLTFVWDPGTLLAVSGGKATQITLPSSGDYEPVAIPDEASTYILAPNGTEQLPDEILTEVSVDQVVSVPASIGTYSTEDVIIGLASPSISVELTKDTENEIIIGKNISLNPSTELDIKDSFNASISIPDGIEQSGRIMYSFDNYIKQTTSPETFGGNIAVKTNTQDRPVTAKPSTD